MGVIGCEVRTSARATCYDVDESMQTQAIQLISQRVSMLAVGDVAAQRGDNRVSSSQWYRDIVRPHDTTATTRASGRFICTLVPTVACACAFSRARREGELAVHVKSEPCWALIAPAR
jgi:hypothetical protein